MLERSIIIGGTLLWYICLCRVDGYTLGSVDGIAEGRIIVYWHCRSNTVEVVNFLLLVVVLLAFKLCALADAYLRVCLEGVLDKLCSKEASVYSATVRQIEVVGLLYSLASVGIPSTIILF